MFYFSELLIFIIGFDEGLMVWVYGECLCLRFNGVFIVFLYMCNEFVQQGGL